MSTFYSHVARSHGIVRRQTRYSFLYTVGIKVQCNVEGCQKILNFTELVKHLKSHIAAGMKVKCPAQGCGRIFSKKSSFSAHLSVKHGILNKNTIDGELLVNCTSGASANVGVQILFVGNFSVLLPWQIIPLWSRAC